MDLFLYDAHVHTAESSLCGFIPAAKVVEEYKAREYAGIAISDHLNEENILALPFHDDWQACMDHFLKGYKTAKAAGDALGLDVILSAEIRFLQDDSDFLLIGVTEKLLRENPYLHRTDLKSFYKKYKNELLIVEAHPYRYLSFPVLPKYLHGVEVINCNERHDSNNEMAFGLCKKHKHLIKICGSDTHRDEDIGRAAMIFHRQLTHAVSFRDAIKEGVYSLFCPEFDHLLQKYM